MTRGTFANIRLRNLLCPGTEGGVTKYLPTGEQMSIYDAVDEIPGRRHAAGRARRRGVRHRFLARLGGQGHVSAGHQGRDRRVSFERIHRSNLVGMGVLPLQFRPGESRDSLGLDGTEIFDIRPGRQAQAAAGRRSHRDKADGAAVHFVTTCRIDTPVEVEYYRNGGILHTVLRQLVKE